jgi:hypothetical protein
VCKLVKQLWLAPEYELLTLRTLDKVARALGKQIKIDLVDVI